MNALHPEARLHEVIGTFAYEWQLAVRVKTFRTFIQMRSLDGGIMVVVPMPMMSYN